MTQEEFAKRYEGYRDEIKEYMKYVYDVLIDKFGEVYSHYLVSLDTLAMNLDIMLMARDTFKKEGFQHKDYGGHQRKSGAVQIFNTAQVAALKIMNNFGLSPMAESRIKTNKIQRDLTDYVNDLTGDDEE